jgi:hypothetical protein
MFENDLHMTRGFFSLTVTSKWATLLHDISMG